MLSDLYTASRSDAGSNNDALQRLAGRSEARLAEYHSREKDRDGWRQRVTWPLWFAALVGMSWWQGWRGFVASGIAFAVYEAWSARARDRTPGADPHMIDIESESYVRHTIVAELSARGEQVWKSEDGRLVAADNSAWEQFWLRVEPVVAEFERLSPRDRRKRLADAMRASKDSREEMMHLAQEYHLEPAAWAIPEKNE